MLPSTICPSSSSCPLHLHHFRLLLVNRLQAFLRAPKRNFLRHFAVYVSMKIQQDTCCASRLSLLASRHWRAPLRELSRKENGASPSGACCKRSQGQGQRFLSPASRRNGCQAERRRWRAPDFNFQFLIFFNPRVIGVLSHFHLLATPVAPLPPVLALPPPQAASPRWPRVCCTIHCNLTARSCPLHLLVQEQRVYSVQTFL